MKMTILKVADEFCSNEEYKDTKETLFSVLGEYKNPKFKPFRKIDPQEEVNFF
jgi:hypothetical protein